MKRIGIIGGTFNPVHYAHLVLAEQAYRQYALDSIIFMPSKHPPHKDNSLIISDEHRLNMLRAAIKGVPYFSVSDTEYKRTGITYTADTLRELKENNSDIKYFFIIGGDSILCFESWHEPEIILQNAVILAGNRNSMDICMLHQQINKLMSKYTTESFIPDIRPLIIPAIDISSKMIRNSIQTNQNIQNLLPENVVKYIYDNGLYKDLLIENILSYIKTKLSENRYRHTLGVADMAANIARYYGEDIKKAYITGLLHDIGKTKSVNELFTSAKEHGLLLSEIEVKQPESLLHAKVGIFYAEELFGVTDKEILDAIKYHTTGRPDMSILEKIIYLSDYIEPNRNMITEPSLDIIRATAYNNIDLAVNYVLVNTINYLSRKGEDIDSITLETYNYYKIAVRRNEEV